MPGGKKKLYLVSSSNSHTLTKEFIERVNNSEYHRMQSTRNRQNRFSLDFKDATIELLKRQVLKTPLLPQTAERLVSAR